MSQSAKRSYEERTSSYKRHFGDGPQRFSYSHSPSRNTVSSSTRVVRVSGSGASRIEPSRASASSSSRIRSSRAMPMASGVTMQDINMLSDALGPEFQEMRINEKEELKTLNTRLAGYIQKVRALEQANQILEAQIEQLNATQPTRLADMYEDELTRLRREVDDTNNQNSSLQIQLDNALIEASKWKQKFDEEAAMNKELENDLNGMRKDCDDATLVRLDLERRLETLQEEIEFLRNVHEQEIAELQDRLRKTDIRIEAAPGPDLEELLEDMRMQYEKLAARNKADAEHWYQEKVENLQQQSVKNDDQMRQVRNELSEYRKSVQTLNMEIDSLRGTNDSLQRALAEMEQRYNRDAKDYQETIDNLQGECDDLKSQMAQQLRQYQELMDVKIALDIEIATYRKLLEGEESRVGRSTADKISEKISKSHSGGTSSSYKMSSANYMGNYPRSASAAACVDDVETVKTTKKVVVKTIETKDGKVISQTEDVREQSTGEHGME